MGYTQPSYSVRGVAAPVGGDMGHIVCFPRDGDRVFLTLRHDGPGNEPVNESLGLLDTTPYGRREGWKDNPEGWPRSLHVGSAVGRHGSLISWSWRSDVGGNATSDRTWPAQDASHEAQVRQLATQALAQQLARRSEASPSRAAGRPVHHDVNSSAYLASNRGDAHDRAGRSRAWRMRLLPALTGPSILNV